ncbi:hypothetical protein [Sinomonas atrocyanea]
MAARPEPYPATHDLIHLLLACSGLDAILSGLADRTARRLAPLGRPDAALALYRRNRPVLTAGSTAPLVRLTQERLADDDAYLASALEHSRPAAEERLPEAWASGISWGVDAGLLVVPVPAGPSATGALVLVGTPPADAGRGAPRSPAWAVHAMRPRGRCGWPCASRTRPTSPSTGHTRCRTGRSSTLPSA